MNTTEKPNYTDQALTKPLGWRVMLAWSLAAASIVTALAAAYMLGRTHASTPAGVEIVIPTPSPLKVQVSGAVRSPGLIELARGDRLADALDRAGGPEDDALLDGMNLAAIVVDGTHIRVPRRTDGTTAPGSEAGTTGREIELGQDGSETPDDNMVAPSILTPTLINLNTASVGQLMDLPNIGPARAQAIINLRDVRGGFSSVDELDDVTGIGPAILDVLRPLVTVQ